MQVVTWHKCTLRSKEQGVCCKPEEARACRRRRETGSQSNQCLPRLVDCIAEVGTSHRHMLLAVLSALASSVTFSDCIISHDTAPGTSCRTIRIQAAFTDWAFHGSVLCICHTAWCLARHTAWCCVQVLLAGLFATATVVTTLNCNGFTLLDPVSWGVLTPAALTAALPGTLAYFALLGMTAGIWHTTAYICMSAMQG